MNTQVSDPLLGGTVDSRYRIDVRLAVGGMATVYHATDLRLDRAVALKIMRPEYAQDPTFVTRFQQEARAAARLAHPNVVGLFDQGEADGLVYLAMEYVPGTTLRDVLGTQGQLSPEQALAVLDPVLQGLGAAHEAGFVHRDVKPENVLVAPNGVVKVTDFGLARALQPPANATQGMLIGTAAYLAPEQVSGGHSDQRSDVYQAGILLYEMLSGSLPHTGENAWSVAYQHVQEDVPALGTVVPQAPTALAALVEDATRRDTDERIGTVAEFLSRARGIAADLPPPLPFRTSHDTVIVTDPDVRPTGLLPVASEQTPSDDAMPPPDPDSNSEAATAQSEEVGSMAPLPPEPPAAGLEGDPNPDKARRAEGRRKMALAFGITLGAVAVTALLAWIVALNPFNRADIPQIVGMTEAKAQKELSSIGFSPEVADRSFSEDVPAGLVVRSDPEQGAGARVGATVALTVSMGPERYAVPKVRGLTPDAAQVALLDANLAVGQTKQVYDDNIAVGLVVKTAPKKGKDVKRDTEIDLLVSQGPAPVDVPNLVGVSEKGALDRLASVGLAGSVTGSDYSESVPDGAVISTSPASGATIKRGDTVSISLSKGPPPVVVPNVVDMQRAQAVAALKAEGFKVEISEGVVTPLDRVFSQDPEGGTSIPKGSTVVISIF
ncbi:MAG: Stk1 family PASTA domain-containing Ser/Thr kinase [Actinomycetia bacterium]|nr:Stk1 family PASTA domain-containing Ser/Thr kinase [Actinomycetes bacterium]